ncbi:MAG: phosphoribosylformylglycinamidine cyclo-ligase [Proteobacteria bacterium]|jgi:phosphoribosylformylglycinamidine cyclo-ligase|nr:phosphoribosylformylglycinamidine cyclo-ligase [Pseudomonadota bacterium]
MSVMDYKKSGVSVEAGDELVEWLAQGQKNQPHQERLIEGIGGFASLFDISFPEMTQPLLVTCTDGVGTKVKLASRYNRPEPIAQDLVAMCANDLICTGGKPLLFLDYYATGKLDLDFAKRFLTSLKTACSKANMVLAGGETAEMPGVYSQGDFDVAGFAVGVVDQSQRLGPHLVQEGDALVAVSSSGCHSNGYSLLRKIFENDLDQWIDELLIPTALYVDFFLSLRKQIAVHALAHITGGGLENVPRVLPSHLKMSYQMWEFPPIFQEIQKRTQMSDLEMVKTLNCGVGLVCVVPQISVAKVLTQAQQFGFQAWEMGKVLRG